MSTADSVIRIPVADLEDVEIKDLLRKYGVPLTVEEARSVGRMVGREPSLSELHTFAVQWSEHCSYKSSRSTLKEFLPTDSRRVIQGPQEDAGIIEFAVHEGKRYGIVIAHESHNHPSQVLPVEGAATGIGGIVRDVDCMGAHVIGVADPLRFGDPRGTFKHRTRGIVEGVVDGIWQYGNALGVPNLGGDVVFDEGFDDNCLVNVVAVGILAEDEILHSRAPEDSKDHVLVLVGKPTDRSGFGGATFSSATLDEEDSEVNKGAVQVPDPFLKNVLLMHKANETVRKRAREKGIVIGFKDLGAGGIGCASSEMGASAGVGIEVDLDKVHVAEEGLPPEVILCAETQERYLYIVPEYFAEEVCRIYNEEWDLPNIYRGARASVIGRVRDDDQFVVRQIGNIVCQAKIKDVTEGVRYDREAKAPDLQFTEPDVAEPADYNDALKRLLGAPNLASKSAIYRYYDSEVQGNTVIRPGEADASLIAPLDGCLAGMALSVDGNPFYGKISPYWGGATAVAECLRNVAAVGATPRGLTDCLNFGNPEKPEDFWAFREGVRGLADAAKKMSMEDGDPVAVVSGNVSLYNQSASGRSIPPSPIIACVGVMDDYSKAITQECKKAGNRIILAGERRDELGGSAYYRVIHNELGAHVPTVDWAAETAAILAVIEAIDQGLVVSAHDISDGGLAASAAEMLLAGHAPSELGLDLDLSNLGSALRRDKVLFSESGGFLLEVPEAHKEAVLALFQQKGAPAWAVGRVIAKPRLKIALGEALVDVAVADIREGWETGLTRALSD